jgi:serine/threonine-protein kinase
MQSNYFGGLPQDTSHVQAQLWPAGTTIAERYEVLAQPYIGKRKAIYRARETKPFVREVILCQPVADTPDVLSPLDNEREALRRISHPGIVIMHDSGQDKEYGEYTVLELIEGPTLAAAIMAERRLELDRTIHLMAQICSALSHVHKNDIAHGSLKANHVILQQPLGQPESIKLIDFSQAHVVQTKRKLEMAQWIEVFQTVGHPSPEELSGEPWDHRADIYSLGCLLYKALTSKAPFNGTSAQEIRQKHIEEKPPMLKETYPQGTFSAKLEECVQKMLAKKPADRYQSTDDLALDLRFAAHRPSKK